MPEVGLAMEPEAAVATEPEVRPPTGFKSPNSRSRLAHGLWLAL